KEPVLDQSFIDLAFERHFLLPFLAFPKTDQQVNGCGQDEQAQTPHGKDGNSDQDKAGPEIGLAVFGAVFIAVINESDAKKNQKYAAVSEKRSFHEYEE